jgi:NADH:ubiquinone oxidoreductase subunit 5 (subunit L)/multisubunit Na+/H+ antiporter MnhA subunit
VLIFISTGYNIAINKGEQEKRKIIIPNTSIKKMMFTATLALIGVPFIAGFYSKDLIIEIIITKQNNIFLISLIFFCCFISAVYSILIIKRIKITKKNMDNTQTDKAQQTIKKPNTKIWALLLILGGLITETLSFQITKPNKRTKMIGILCILRGTSMTINKNKNTFTRTSKINMITKLSLIRTNRNNETKKNINSIRNK